MPVIGMLTSCLFTNVVEELILGISVLQIQRVVRAEIEPGILDSKPSVLTTLPPDIIKQTETHAVGGLVTLSKL